MGDPRWAYKDTELCPEEPEACYCLPIYGQSSECLWPQWPQSNLQLCENTGSVWVLYFLLTRYNSSCREAASINVSPLLFYFFLFVCTNRQHYHHAGSGSPSHPEGAGRRGHPPVHTKRPFIFCCQGAVDGEGTILPWLSCTQSIFFFLLHVNMGKDQMYNFSRKCKHIAYIYKWCKSRGFVILN